MANDVQTGTNSERCLHEICEITLATIEKLAMLSRQPKGEWQRQVNAAQIGINYFKEAPEKASLRVADVLTQFNGDVKKWADSLVRH